MDIASRLDLFLDVVKEGSYTKAADLRHMDRSSLSKQVTALEKDLGIRLLNRSTRSLSLTEAGKQVLKQAESVRQMLSDTYRIVENFHNEPKGLVRITSPALFGKLYVQKVIRQFMQTFPDAHVHLTLDNRNLSAIDDRYDLAFSVEKTDASNFVARKLADNPLVLLASPAFIEQYGYPQAPTDLVSLPAVFLANDGLVVNRIAMTEKSGKKEPMLGELRGRYRVNEPELLLDAVRSGMGFGIFARYMLGSNIQDLGLVPLLEDYQIPDSAGGIFAIHPNDNPTLLVRKFIEMMEKEMGAVPAWEHVA